MRTLIQTKLQNLEKQHDIKILYAVESGSIIQTMSNNLASKNNLKPKN